MLILNVGLFGVGDRDLAQKALQLFLLARIFGSLKAFGDDSIDRVIDAADEETGYAGNFAQVQAL